MSDDPRQLLQDTARGPAAPLEVERLWRHGRRRKATRLVAGVAVAMVLVALVGMALLPGLSGRPVVFGGPQTTEGPEPVLTDEGGVGQATDPAPEVTGGPEAGPPCEAPPYRPTYLPWLGDGETAGGADADLGGTPEARSAVRYWVANRRAFERDPASYEGAALTVAANVTLEHEPGTGEYLRVTVQGQPGDLVWTGDPGVGGVSVVWREGPDPCGSYSVGFPMTRALLPFLDVSGPGADGDDDVDEAMLEVQLGIEAELLRVVDSLQREG